MIPRVSAYEMSRWEDVGSDDTHNAGAATEKGKRKKRRARPSCRHHCRGINRGASRVMEVHLQFPPGALWTIDTRRRKVSSRGVREGGSGGRGRERKAGATTSDGCAASGAESERHLVC